MRALPNMTVVVPADAIEVGIALEEALQRDGPTYLRIGRNPSPVLFAGDPPMATGEIRRLRAGGDLTLAVCGVPTAMAIEAAAKLAAEGVQVDLLEVATLKPLDVATLEQSVRKTGRVVTVEEHNIIGGLAGAVAECLGERWPAPIERVGVQDCFAESGDYTALLEKYGLSVPHIVAACRRVLGRPALRVGEVTTTGGGS
jgi:transketolase